MSLDTALQFLREGQIDEAISECLTYIADFPDDPQSRVLLANGYYLKGCTELASEEIIKLRSKYPQKISLKRLYMALQLDADDDLLAEGEYNKEPLAEQERESATSELDRGDREDDDVLAESDFDIEDLDLLIDED